jgi:formamidopyrimidine-DNA glycosylase
MSGRLMLVASDRPIEPHTHLRIEVPAINHDLRFRDPRRFGGIWCFAGSKTHVGKRLGELGVEPLETNAATFRKILHRKRQIKALLMDQRIIAGLGNIYCDEALHAAGIHPLTPANTLEAARAGRLLRAIKSTLRRAIRHKGSTLADYRQADGEAGSFQKYHRVYRREGKTCQRCGTMITRIRAAGRSTYLCPRCQTGENVKKPKRQKVETRGN